jgi:hypothetical protein
MTAKAFVRAGLALVLAGAIGVYGSGSGSAASRPPSLALISVLTNTTADRFPDDSTLFLTPGVYVAAQNGAVEFDIHTDGTTTTVWQVRRDQNGAHNLRQITPNGPINIPDGLPNFFTLTLNNARGIQVATQSMPFCPGGNSRVNPNGPPQPTLPQYCGDGLTQGAVLGIDNGWGAPLYPVMTIPRHIRDGQYTLTIAIDPAYASQLQIPAAQATATLGVTLTSNGGGKCPPFCSPAQAAARSAGTPAEGPHGPVSPYLSAAAALASGPDGVPDMRALPAHDMSTEHNPFDGNDYLDFAATIWNAGTGPLVLEGFRPGAAELMPVTQFIYRNGKPVSSQQVGEFEFDTRPGHDHWHMEDVAAYDMLDATGTQVVISDKQSFCLAPTDPIDLTAVGAAWLVDQNALWSACGGEDAIWIREVLPAGWGDTYYQSVAGQSFDITGLANGVYQVRVTTDPFHRLIETDYSNNASLVKVQLGGTPGNRTVTVLS